MILLGDEFLETTFADLPSSYESLCDLEGCLVTLNKGDIKDLTAFDDAHLTLIAAQFLVTKNKNVFLPEGTNGLAIPR